MMRTKLIHRSVFWFCLVAGTVAVVWGVLLAAGLPVVGAPQAPICDTAVMLICMAAVALTLVLAIARLETPPLRPGVVALLLSLVIILTFVVETNLRGPREWMLKLPGSLGCLGSMDEAIHGLPTQHIIVIAAMTTIAAAVVLVVALADRWPLGWYRLRGIQFFLLSLALGISALAAISFGRVFVNRIDPSAGEWVLIAAGALVILRQAVAYVRRRAPGSVELATIINATGDDEISVDSITAQLKEMLARIGLRPPAGVPGGGLPQALIDVATDSALGQAKWIAKLLTVARDGVLGGGGHKVGAVLQGRETPPKYGLTIDVSATETASTENIQTLWGETADEVVARAAYMIYQQVLAHPDVRGASPWERWSDREAHGLEAYQEGITAETARAFDIAIAKYQGAAALEPLNATIRLRLGAVLEGRARPADALICYLQAYLHWGTLYRVRYRLAIAYDSTEIVSGWESFSGETRDSLLTLFIMAESADSEMVDRIRNLNDGWQIALMSWMQLRSDAHWEWLGKHLPEPNEHLDPFHARSAAVVGAQVSWLLHEPSERLRGGLKKRERKIGRALSRDTVLGHYNAACFYSVAMNIESLQGNREEFAHASLWHLSSVFRNRSVDFNTYWICQDSDLRAIRGDPRFEAEYSIECEEKEMSEKSTDLEELCKTWDVLSDWSKQAVDAWIDRNRQLDRWDDVDRALLDWCAQEREIWHALAESARNPLADLPRLDFWAALGVLRKDPAAKPTPSKELLKCDEEDTWQRAVAIRNHVVAWEQVHEEAQRLEQSWQSLESHVAASGDADPLLAIEKVRKWCRAAEDVWTTLQRVPDAPSSDRLAARFAAAAAKFRGETATTAQPPD